MTRFCYCFHNFIYLNCHVCIGTIFSRLIICVTLSLVGRGWVVPWVIWMTTKSAWWFLYQFVGSWSLICTLLFVFVCVWVECLVNKMKIYNYFFFFLVLVIWCLEVIYICCACDRKMVEKIVVAVRIGENVGKLNNEGLPLDFWAWRKYGQNPIKGSPYPRCTFFSTTKLWFVLDPYGPIVSYSQSLLVPSWFQTHIYKLQFSKKKKMINLVPVPYYLVPFITL